LGKNGVFYTVGTGAVRAHNKDTGAVLWTTSGLPGSLVQGIAIDVNDRIFATTSNGYVVSISPAGTILWQIKVCDIFKTMPVIGPDGVCVAYGRTGFDDILFAIK
jgi:outer membrane protein assembly factor BamB